METQNKPLTILMADDDADDRMLTGDAFTENRLLNEGVRARLGGLHSARILLVVIEAFDFLDEFGAGKVAGQFLKGGGHLIVGRIAARVGDIGLLAGHEYAHPQDQGFEFNAVDCNFGHEFLHLPRVLKRN